MPSLAADAVLLQQLVWSGSLPLEIRLAAGDCRLFDQSDSYFIQHNRQSYLGLLLTRLHDFFKEILINTDAAAHDAWLDFEGVPLKWHYPTGLLYDLYSGAEPITADSNDINTKQTKSLSSLPWRLTIHYSDFPSDQLIQLDTHNRVLLDAYINNVKEADFIRNGTARAVMSLSKDDSDKLWQAVENHDFNMFNSVNNKLISPPGITIKHTPLKIYLPSSTTPVATDVIEEEGNDDAPKAGHFRVVQTLVTLQTASKQPQTVGSALNSILPELFPSRRSPLLAQPVLHGALLPMSTILDDLSHSCAYLDGFLHISIVMLS